MADRLKLGIVGANAEGQGWAPLAHLPALRTLPEWELAAVCTAHEETAKASAQKYGVARAFHDVNDLVKEPDLDLISVVVKAPNHHQVVMAALNAGKNVFCEWPLGANTAQAEEMAALAKAKGVRAQVGLQGQADPSVNYLRELVADGYLGEVLSVNMAIVTGGVLETGLGRMWAADRRAGVGTLTVRGMHTIDAMCHVLGDFAELSAQVTTQVRQWKVAETGQMIEVDAPDNIFVHGRLESGAVVSSYASLIPYNAYGWRLEIFGRKGTIIASTDGSPQRDAARLMGSQGGAPLAELTVPEHFTLVPPETPKGPPLNVGHLYRRMAEAIRNGTPAAPDFDHAVKRHRLIDAIVRSSEEGRKVTI
jgi:predicted dehydrogenase